MKSNSRCTGGREGRVSRRNCGAEVKEGVVVKLKVITKANERGEKEIQAIASNGWKRISGKALAAR